VRFPRATHRVSGATLDRAGLQAMLTDAARGGFQAVVVAKMDRLARDLMAQLWIEKEFQLWIEKELMKAGVEIVSVAEPFRGQDPANVLRLVETSRTAPSFHRASQ